MRPTDEFEIPVASAPPTQPAMPPAAAALRKLERATVITPQPGDLLVFEMPRLSDQEYDEAMSALRQACPEGVTPIIIEGGRFGGVIRPGAGGHSPAPASPGVLVRSCRNCHHDIFQPTPGAGWQHRAIGHCSRPEPQS